MVAIAVGTTPLTLPQLRAALEGPVQVSIADEAVGAIDAAAGVVADIVATGEVVYGVNTGFGLLANTTIATHELEALQRNLVLSHACGVGEARIGGRIVPAAEALALAGLEPLSLGPKEGLALLNGTQVSTEPLDGTQG